MTRARSLYLAFAAVLLLPMAANADLIKVDAESLIDGLDDFYIVYDDTGDGLLQWAEVVEFSGFTFQTTLYSILYQIPNLPGISTLSFDPLRPDFAAIDDWLFGRVVGADITCSNGDPGVCWSYSASAVPEPGTLALFGLGLMGMVASRRRKKT